MVSALATIIAGVMSNPAPEVDYYLLPNDIINVQVADHKQNTDLSMDPPEASQACSIPQLSRRKSKLVRRNSVSLFPNGFLGICR